ncbi:hypothetical protein PR202_gb06179 [Eleusine coracana subsp. coracana]|uniref:Uncharacterized protein n=1 Tax=Eleusine coracana subsp. coracana TaxID=191504 RepID=A0AAV5E6G2_ELECO|nr:hypothetical protein PR202_gb06179 [Eleusine coracana subsp. coracana]
MKPSFVVITIRCSCWLCRAHVGSHNPEAPGLSSRPTESFGAILESTRVASLRSASSALLRVPVPATAKPCLASSEDRGTMRQPTMPGAPPIKVADHNKVIGRRVVRLLQAPAVVALAAVLAVSTPGTSEPLCNLPPELSGELQGEKSKIRHPKSDQAARCTSKCVSTCVLGGYGAPGVGGPFNVRSLTECSDVCNLIKDGEDDQ